MDNDKTIDIDSRITTEFGDAFLNRSGRYVVRISSNIYVPLHRLICQQVYGDIRNKEVHHIDGNKLNNDPSNLIPLTPTEHKLEHERMRREERAQKRAQRKGVM